MGHIWPSDESTFIVDLKRLLPKDIRTIVASGERKLPGLGFYVRSLVDRTHVMLVDFLSMKSGYFCTEKPLEITIELLEHEQACENCGSH